jgi:hypothetical protein
MKHDTGLCPELDPFDDEGFVELALRVAHAVLTGHGSRTSTASGSA